MITECYALPRTAASRASARPSSRSFMLPPWMSDAGLYLHRSPLITSPDAHLRFPVRIDDPEFVNCDIVGNTAHDGTGNFGNGGGVYVEAFNTAPVIPWGLLSITCV